MENNPLVSIIIPVYNIEKYLDECINSCLSQTYKNIEILLVNDGSTDGCAEMIREYAAKDHRVINIEKQNEGVYKARLNGLNVAKGVYILNVDGDDFLATDAVESLVSMALQSGADMVFADYYRYYETKKTSVPIIDVYEDQIVMSGLDVLKKTGRASIWMRLMRREVAFLDKPYPYNMGEDLFALLQILPKCSKVIYLKKILYYYRIRGGSLMCSSTTVRDDIRHKQMVLDFVVKENYPKEVIETIVLGCTHVIAEYCGDYHNKITRDAKGELKELIRSCFENYPSLLKDNLTSEHLRSVVITWILRYFPWMASWLYQYNRLRGKTLNHNEQ